MKFIEVVTVLNTHAGGATTVVNDNLEEIDELAPHVDPTHTHTRRLVDAVKGEQGSVTASSSLDVNASTR